MPINRRRLLPGELGACAGPRGRGRTLRRSGGLRSARARQSRPPPASPPGSAARSCIGTRAFVAIASVPPSPSPLRCTPDTLARFVDPLPAAALARARRHAAGSRDPGASLPYYRVAMRAGRACAASRPPADAHLELRRHVPGPDHRNAQRARLARRVGQRAPRAPFLAHRSHAARRRTPISPRCARWCTCTARRSPRERRLPGGLVPPGHSAACHYPNRQDATMLWYHDHAMGIERLNLYAGSSVSSSCATIVEDALDLPSGALRDPARALRPPLRRGRAAPLPDLGRPRVAVGAGGVRRCASW